MIFSKWNQPLINFEKAKVTAQAINHSSTYCGRFLKVAEDNKFMATRYR